jgi:hypothetical protein
VREVARRADEEARGRLARADSVWTLFHFGFAVDEQLADRLAYHRQCRQAPEEALGQGFRVGAWSKGVFEGLLSGLAKPRARITPVGRKVDASAASPAEAAVLLTAALLPLPASYPLPYIEVTA